MTSVNLPWPPSANTYYRRVGAKTLISAKGRDYCAAVMKACAEARISRQDGRLAVVINACPPDRRRRDLDNLLKGLLDALTHGGAWEDDSQIDHLTIKRGPIKALGCVEVTISEIDGEAA
ncbi:RusA family crossover junction endodeoxyribonuclease [Stutzerimonas stutzeri]|uniref:RusA family crossover junction endodeoxyribonuclease n=1 Tax=Stutzerimonas stutzeri TaxID=316 RepID=UPI000F7894F6|nr:RusA family crossover junction endodeoxyribonuclease [Stutzerimonas stutzeri]RRV38639.1 RusA family crossover junction endodeoxyribonuclease [Stutzerimonas stutzeri]RRV38702.1 RusA family crossover junction endodeoxyribonuclease [Stutzerimonas stutzeri]